MTSIRVPYSFRNKTDFFPYKITPKFSSPGLSHPFLGMGPGPLELGKIASFGRALDLRNLGPKFGPIPKAKKYVFFPILDEKFPIWQSVFGSGKYQVD